MKGNPACVLLVGVYPLLESPTSRKGRRKTGKGGEGDSQKGGVFKGRERVVLVYLVGARRKSRPSSEERRGKPEGGRWESIF